ncbi:sickle tail protein homolog [Megalops cyprinoides]|uniref:sickle tail protein homolog n=1 Tax=Megalops cyprinoides TaxID=118141 RepID=UPI001864EDC4|nr:sickle tail protein homolog [Megalops cyprinoides]
MSKPSRLARPSSAGAGSKLPSPRKECQGSRPRVLSVGEKLMRAGSEGNLVRQKPPQQPVTEDPPPTRRKPSPPKEQGKGNLRVTSPEDAEQLSRKQSAANGSSRPDPKSCRSVPRRHTVGGPRSSREILAMQPSDMDKKREAFLEHLKQKYPHHASAIMGHQERLREQSRSPKHSPSPQPGAGDQAEHLSVASLDSLDAMSEGDAPTAFTRGSRSRASLPVVRSTNQTKDRSLGVLYLQYGDETKQIRMPNEITSADTIRALFVSAFPQQLSMKMLESPSVAVYIKDDVRNMYYELSDVRNITDHSCLKVYHKDPAHAFSHNSRPTNGDARMHREILYTRDGQHTLRQQPMGPPLAHTMQGSLSPPTAHSMPPSPSRIPFGPRGVPMPGSATIPRDRLSSVPPNRSVSPCPSAILERRDVKPDEDMGNKNVALVRSDGLYADPYMLHEGRLSIASGHSGHPADVVDHGIGGGFHRASIRSNSSYASSTMSSEGMEHHSLYRQKSRKYGDSQLPTLGSKTPPPSPHRMTDVRLVDIHAAQSAHIPPQAAQLERGSPVRQSFRKENSGPVEVMTKARSNMASPVIPDLPMAHGSAAPPNDPQTRERMKAMEQQIASLTGLVQHALLKGPAAGGAKEVTSDKTVKRSSPVHTSNSGGASPIPAAKSSAESCPTPPPPLGPAPVQVNLLHFRKNVSDLRVQLHQMRQLQLQNQETLKLMLKRAEQEISGKLVETMKRLEDPVQRQRVLVEEERHKYLSMEERVLTQLGELEQYVDELKKDSSSATVHRAVTLKDVEEGAVGLRKVGESLAGLKGEFPALQTKMRAVLRVEVEAVKFLKEEPHKLDSMLKRVKTLTETLSGLRRQATDSLLKGTEVPPAREGVVAAEAESEPPPVAPQEPSAPASLPSPAPPPVSPTALPEPQSSSIRSEVMPASPLVIHHAQSAPVHMQQSQQSAALVAHPSPPPTPTQGRESPTAGKGNSPSKGSSPALTKKPTPSAEQPASVAASNGSVSQALFIEEVHSSREKTKQRALSIEAAEKEWEEKRQNMGHYDGKEFEKILQEAQANMMKGIPNLEVTEEKEAPLAPPAAQEDEVDAPQPAEPPPPPEEAPPEEPSTDNPVQPVSETAAQPSSERPPPVVEKPPKPSAEKPNKPSADKAAKLSTEKAGKSPPPPPPRRNYPPGSGLTTGRSGEVIFTSRKEPVSPQEGEEEGTQPQQPKPSKIPPETKPKPQTPPPIAASAIREEEDEGDKIMAELQNTSVASSTSRMPVPVSAKSRQPPGGTEKAGKQQKLPDPQRQFRQANGSAKKAGGENKANSPTLPASKIPAFYPSSGKSSSLSAPNSDATNPINSSSSASSSSSSSSKSSIPSPSHPGPHPSRLAPSSSHIPSLSNGTLKLPGSTHTGKGPNLSFSPQTQNGRTSSSSSSFSPSALSPLSPTTLGQGAKSIRTIHTPSFTSYKPHNGNSSKATIPSSSSSKDTA